MLAGGCWVENYFMKHPTNPAPVLSLRTSWSIPAIPPPSCHYAGSAATHKIHIWFMKHPHQSHSRLVITHFMKHPANPAPVLSLRCVDQHLPDSESLHEGYPVIPLPSCHYALHEGLPQSRCCLVIIVQNFR